nr:NB-ARC domain-containing protein [uncultured Actinomyces sp.]
MNVEETAEPYFDELIEAVATQYAALVPWSTRFQIEAFKSILSGNDEIRDNSRRSLHAHEMTHEILHTVLSNLAEATHHENKPSRVFFGSRPDVVSENRFVERSEQEHLNALITDPTKQRTVLVGMRGCGKTQLAAVLAKKCEDLNWSLVAWVNAASPESLQSALVELAKRLKIDTSDQPTQEQIIGRCLDDLRSSEASDRLIIFDNVEDINNLGVLVPSGEGLRVVATTTNKAGWEDQRWNSIKVGVFDREKSIDYLLKVTKSDDRDVSSASAVYLSPLLRQRRQPTTSTGHSSITSTVWRNTILRVSSTLFKGIHTRKASPAHLHWPSIPR